MRGWEEGGRANTQTGALLTFSEKGPGSSRGSWCGEQELFLESHVEWLKEELRLSLQVPFSSFIVLPVDFRLR